LSHALPVQELVQATQPFAHPLSHCASQRSTQSAHELVVSGSSQVSARATPLAARNANQQTSACLDKVIALQLVGI
jgi:hypothetical protein